VTRVRLVFIAGGLALVDQVTKLAAVRMLPAGRRLRVIPGVLDLHRVKNPAFALRTLAELQPPWRELMLVGLPALVVCLLLLALRRRRAIEPALLDAVGLILGGALGNLIDRVRDGYVTDFIQLFGRRTPTLNLADLFTVCGLVWLLGAALMAIEQRSIMR
jgi:signal peptidase II